MDEQKVREDKLESRLSEIESELKSLRSTLDRQGELIGGIDACLSRIQSQLAEISQPSRKVAGGPFRSLLKAWMGAYIAGARLLLRANVEELFDRGYYHSILPGLAASGTDPVYHYLTAKSGISPHWLFHRQYYLAAYPDVAGAKVDPLVHFLRSGWREGRNPHPLFDTRFYLSQLPGGTGSLNPVAHYLQAGWRNHIQPHPLIDGKFYLETQPDVVSAGMDPLSHYLLFGAFEGRKPHPWFDPAYYRNCYPDVARARMEPLQHYLLHGAREERTPHPAFDPVFYVDEYGPLPDGMSPLEHFVRFGEKQNFRLTLSDRVESFLPAPQTPQPAPRNRRVDIVIPVYRGLEETRACIESVLACANREPFELIVIDDCSPDAALASWLAEAALGGRFTLLTNEKNLGFVATVNRGMSLHEDRDLVLLNSDTLVANDWLDRLVRCAYRSDRTGTVTPFSNNATICSYPRFCQDNPLPPGLTPAQLDQLAAEANQGRSVNIPTAVGFCMYIRRDCLRETGLFDVEAFGAGYGEENDFCLRAAARGWRNVLAADVFVYHAGSVSFAGSADIRRARAARTLAARHPNYSALVSRHVSLDPAQPYRFALTAARFRASGNPTVLLVTHGLGGGVGQHVEDLAGSLRSSVNFLELQAAGGSLLLLRSPLPDDGVSIRLDFTRQYDTLIKLLRSCAVSRIHIHHALRHYLSLENLRDDLEVPVVFTAHDYYALCPRVVLADPEGRYCGEPAEAGCNHCIRDTLPHINLDIASWRAKHAWLIESSTQVIAPTRDVAMRLGRYFPAARIEAASHPGQTDPALLPPVRLPRIESDGVLRVAVLGVMSAHKGLHLLEGCARLAKEGDLPLEFVLAGYCEPQVRDQGPFTFQETGEYARTELPSVLEGIDPGIIWFPVRLPETFSYTLSTCFELGLPVSVPRIGALAERVANRAGSWIYDWDSKPEDLIAFFLRIREAIVSGSVAPAAPAIPRAQAAQHFYEGDYRAVLMSTPVPVDLRQSGRLSVMALLSSYDSGQIQSCGYIRSYLPLTHPELKSLVRLSVTSPATALTMKSDVLLVQRTSVSSREGAEKLVRHCKREGIRIVYETDDDLFHIDETHSEAAYYAPRIEAARWIARHAAMILVSTPALRESLRNLNPEIRVVPNALDESLWFDRLDLKPSMAKRNRLTGAQTVRILYMGTMTHSRDLELLEEPMRMLRDEFGSRIQLDIVGITAQGRDRDWFHAIPVPGLAGHSYPLFVEWLREQNVWDFAVAPLVDDAFNRSKSYIKYLDYGALGLPCAFSGIGVFEDVVRNGENGLIVRDPSDWYSALRLLATDKSLRTRMGAAARRDVEANHTLAAQAYRHKELWAQIAALPEVRSSSTIVSFSEETAAASSKGI